MSHENEKAIWIDKTLSYRLGVASKIAGKTIKQYVTACIIKTVEKDLEGLDFGNDNPNTTMFIDEGGES